MLAIGAVMVWFTPATREKRLYATPAATLAALAIGLAIGLVAAWFGGWVDSVTMRLVDIQLAFPFILLALAIIGVLGPGLRNVILVLGVAGWMVYARVVRGQVLSVREREFVEAARAAGVGTFGIIRRHIVPNVVGPVIVYVTLTIPGVILAESFLSFLGLGIREPFTSWGVLISDGAGQMETAPWALLFPAAFMALTLFCFNFIGDGLRDALDPKDR